MTEMVEQCISENAHVAQNQKDYQKKYDALSERYDRTKERLDKVNGRIMERQARRELIEAFLRDLAEMDKDVQEFTDDFGNALTRHVQRRMERSYPNLEIKKILDTPTREKDREVFARGCCFYKLAGLFFIGSFLGDLVETIFCYVRSGVLMSRSSVVYGPFSIVWGFGCALLTAFLYKYREKSDRYIFVYGTVLGGAYEYICSVLSELVFGTVFWDYSEIPFNLGGRINLLYCFFWGIAAVVWLKILYPILSSWIEKLPVRTGTVLTWVMVVFMTVNMAISALALYRYDTRREQPEAQNGLERFLDTHFDDARMEKIYPDAKAV